MRHVLFSSMVGNALEWFETPLIIGWYIILCCLISFIALCFYKDDWQRDLNRDPESPSPPPVLV